MPRHDAGAEEKEVEAVSAEARHLSWGADALWHRLEPVLPGVSIEVVASTESTNTQLIERARRHGGRRDAPVTRPGDIGRRLVDEPTTPHGRRSTDSQPCLLVAEHQTRGRGRLGRDWVAQPGASLTFSLALPLRPRQWSGLSLAVGVALADALEPPDPGARLRIGLKWPNDLWLMDAPGRGRKLGGILIETVAMGEHRMCVIGIGLNVQAQRAEGFSNGYAHLQELDWRASAPRALSRLAVPLVQVLRRFESDGFAAFRTAFDSRDLLRGQAVTTTQADCPQGVAEGVTADGSLQVRAEQLHLLSSGEVSVRLRQADAEPRVC